MKKIMMHCTLPLLAVFAFSSGAPVAQFPQANAANETGTWEMLIVAHGSVAIHLDVNRLNGLGFGAESKPETLIFQAADNSFLPILVFNNELRGTKLGSMALAPRNSALLPGPLNASFNQLVFEKIPASEPYEFAIRDGKTGFVFFHIEGINYSYDAPNRILQIKDGRLLLAEQFAQSLGRPLEANTVVGDISLAATMRPIEVRKVVNGVDQSAVLPPAPLETHPDATTAFVPGPDVIVGDLPALQQFGSSGTQVGLAVGTTSCNTGNVQLDWFALPNVDHPVIPQNLYRMSGGTSNTDRFEQIGQSWLKHAFTALQENACSFGCTSAADGTHLGVGCSDPYSVSLNSTQSGLGSRAWVNPFTGAFPATARDHTGHTHTGISHRIIVDASDLNTTTNAGATYYAEAQYVTPHEYTWCAAHPGQCNMYNNASYRRFNVTGTTTFSFSSVGATVQMSPAIKAWTGATINTIEPDPGNDGRAFIAYKVTGPVNGLWHYEYALNNQNLDRAIQSFAVPLGCGINISNTGFHAPKNEQGWANDGTLNSAGFSNTPWTTTQTANALNWQSETFAQNQNANALRWGTLYNFRFDSDHPPAAANATVGFFKTGAPITVAIQAPAPDACSAMQLVSAVSRKTHGTAGTFDIPLPLTGQPGLECRASGATGMHTLVFTFTNSVVSGALQITAGKGSAGTPTFSGTTMTVSLADVPTAQRLTFKLTGVTDNFSQVLPDTTVNMNVLLGDDTGNGLVNEKDLDEVVTSKPVANALNFRNDVTADGRIDQADSNIVTSMLGATLP